MRKSFLLFVAVIGALVGLTSPAHAATTSWRVPSALHTSRYLASAVALPDGTVMVVGGIHNSQDAFANLDTAELYDPATRSWTELPKMGSERGGLPGVAVLPDGRVLVAGGHRNDGTISWTSEIFDPVTRTWSDPAPTPEAIGYRSDIATMADGRVYFLGYRAHVYDPASGAWTLLALPPVNIWAISPVNAQQLVAVEPSGASWTYDVATAEWTQAGVYPGFIQEHQSTPLPDGRLFMATTTGGWSDDQAAAIFDPDTRTWTAVPATAQPFGAASIETMPDGRVLVAGGAANSMAVATAALYSPQTDTWTTAPSLPGPRNAASSVQTKTGVLVIGGGDNESYSIGDSMEFVLPAFANGAFAVSDAAANEGGLLESNALTFTIDLVAPASKPVHLRATTSDGTATGNDYTAAVVDIVIKKGQSSATFVVSTKGDLQHEGDEVFSVEVKDTKTGATARALGLVRNDDPAPCSLVPVAWPVDACAVLPAG